MLSAMTEKGLKLRIARIAREIAGLGPLRPGTLYRALNVCGTPGCRCRRRKNPVRHGPYSYLSYTLGGKSHTEFVRDDEVSRTAKEVGRYERLMELVRQLVKSNIELCRLLRRR